MRLVSTVAIFALLVLCLPGANAQPPSRDGGRGGGDRSRFGGRDSGDRGSRGGPSGGFGSPLDQNGDGRIDQNELNNLPEGLRRAMESRGVKLQPGLSVENFGNSMRQQFERSRDRGGETPGERRPEDRPDERSSGNRSQYKPPAPFRARQTARLTVDLPPKYSELDTDFDGQVGLYEWITARRENLQQFDDIDIDVDGVLTPRELKLYDEVSSGGSPQLASFKRPRVTIIGGPHATSVARSSKGRNGKSHLSEEAREKHADFASTKAFPYIDVNKDGRITMEELQRDEKTKRIIPMFEKAGIRVESMSQQEFTDRWMRAQEFNAAQKAEGGGDRRR